MTDTMDRTASSTGTGGPGGPAARATSSLQTATAVPIEDMAVALMERARDQGVTLVGPGGLLQGLAKTVIESALEAELTEHVGYEPYDPAGHHSGNSRNGTRAKTVITDIGPIAIEVPATGTAASSRSWSANASAAWAGWTPWCARCRPGA